MKKEILTFAGILSSAGCLSAVIVIENVTADATSWWDDQLGVNSMQWIGNVTNNSGMSATYDLAGTHAPSNNAVGMWHAREWAVDPNPTVTFDLGGAYDLAGIHIWNGNQPVNLAHIRRGVNEFVLSGSTDGVNYVTIGTFNLAVSPFPGTDISAQDFDLSGQNGITHVQLRVNSTHNSPAGAGDYASLSEVMFTTIPEPSSALLSALAVLGCLARRR